MADALVMPPRTRMGLPPVLRRTERHAVRREGDEQACSCGKRWPVGEAHP